MVAREFRATWIATVSNIDWPSKPGLTTDQQRTELLSLLDRAAQIKLNAVILQVRPACDSLYPSALEPWSFYLAGRMGQAPEPAWDPLKFAVQEAHRRGLELHAWFNPYRALHPSGKGPVHAGHIINTQPDLIRRYGPYVWLDPGEAAVEDYSRAVILDVVRRYDIDAVHIDDYFYPYPLKTKEGRLMEFPDEKTYQRYRANGGTMARDDWRRFNVDRFVHRLHAAIKREKPWVKFGISPFGIWMSGHPPGVKGLSARDAIHADSRKWLAKGWLDYLAPQLYWPINAKEQSFSALLNWWAAQNSHPRHVWPGLRLVGLDGQVSTAEIFNEIQMTRRVGGVDGHVLWSSKTLLSNEGRVATMLSERVYQDVALVPSLPWLDDKPPGAPALRVWPEAGGRFQFAWQTDPRDQVRWWLVQTRYGTGWKNKLYPSEVNRLRLSQTPLPEVMAVRAVDRYGNVGPVTSYQISRGQ